MTTNDFKTNITATQLASWISYFYILFVLVILPLYAPDGYYNIGSYKWVLWISISTIYIALMVLAFVLRYCDMLKNKKHPGEHEEISYDSGKDTLTDYFMIGYMLLSVISAIVSPFGIYVWNGAKDWNMGLWSQITFVLVYFFVSRTCNKTNYVWCPAIITACIVSIIEILNRFGVDPLGFYEGLDIEDVLMFLSTIGQSSWYSSYLVLFIPLAICAYVCARSDWGKILSVIALSIVFMSLVTQNSDSGYMSFSAIMFIMFWIGFESNKNMKDFLEILIIALASWKIIGIFQALFSDYAFALDRISMTLSMGNLTWVALAMVLGIYLIFIRILKNKEDFDIAKYRRARLIILLASILGMVLLIVYVVLNTNGMLSEQLSSNNNYLMFSDEWGNYRGYTWKAAVNAFCRESWGEKIIGTGPDTFGPNIYRTINYQDANVNEFFMSHMVSCAHNEWLNVLINGGILGMIAYMGLYISCFIRCMKNGSKNYHLYGIAMAIASYMAHNIFCYQQVVCTSVIFVFMGIAEAIIRKSSIE